ncbi:hypothetical protein EW145_g2674 [Phellinidium pouzarii]|uniref:Uncharacterized protein n=1 Tax=Phellinidium pouzarii TaxID=167371 RepID=A0A4S4LA75_9AGAM|nr:hypothetical protein EW145_g2674 [Phellinidium pouzarii]
MTINYQSQSRQTTSYGKDLEWDAESLYTNFADVSGSLFSTSTSTLSPSTVGTMSSASATLHVSTHSTSMKDILFKSLAFVTMLPRISSARNELARVQRRAFPAPLYRQKRILDDLLELSRDELPYQMRKAALKLLHFSFEYLVQEIFDGRVNLSRFASILSKPPTLKSEELPFSVRKEGFLHFYLMVGAGATIENKNFSEEEEDCRIILQLLKTTTQISLKLAACAYLWLACWTFREHLVYRPISESEHGSVCFVLAELTQNMFPVETRRDALDWLWKLEISSNSGLTSDERHNVWMNILDLSEYTAVCSPFLLHRQTDAMNDYFSGLRRLWWFNLLDSWIINIKDEKERKRRIGADLFSVTNPKQSIGARRHAFELIALFSNLPHWKDLYDEPTWRLISDQFAEFCLRDSDKINKEDVMRRAAALLFSSTGTSNDIVTSHRELQISKCVSVVITREHSQIATATDMVRQNCSPKTTVEATLENLAVFTLPGESLMIQKDQQAILRDRICNYASFDSTRPIAIQAMYALMTIQDWLSGIRYAEGPTDEDEGSIF